MKHVFMCLLSVVLGVLLIVAAMSLGREKEVMEYRGGDLPLPYPDPPPRQMRLIQKPNCRMVRQIDALIELIKERLPAAKPYRTITPPLPETGE